MESSRFNDELNYQVTMKMVASMLKQGIIDEEDYKEINRKFTEKYNPPIGTLLSDIELT